MSYSPPRVKGALSALCIALLVLALLLFWGGSRLPYGGIMQIGGVAALTAFLFLNIRYTLSDYRYVIDGSSLIVFRRQGKREMQMCDIELSAALSLCPRSAFDRQKTPYQLCYNFCQNFASKDTSCLRFTFNDQENKIALVYLELDDAMKKEIEKYL